MVLGTGALVLLIPNVALNGEATQSSDHHHTVAVHGTSFVDPDYAHYAIDGKFGTDLGARDRCAITNADPGAWWQADLKYQMKIEKVAVTTRNCCKYYYVIHIHLNIFVVLGKSL